MKDLIIVGNKTYAQMMKKYIEMTSSRHVLAYVVDKEYIKSPIQDGISVISFDELFDGCFGQDIALIMGIGYIRMGNVRKNVFERCKKAGFEFENYIHPTAILPPDLQIGEGNNILESVIFEAGVSIGNANFFCGGSIIGHDSSIGDYNTFSVNAATAGFVHVKNNCFIGVSAAIKDHVTLHDYVLLGAMACGFKDMQEYSVVSPAKSEILHDKKSTDIF